MQLNIVYCVCFDHESTSRWEACNLSNSGRLRETAQVFVYACTGTPESRMFKLRKLENRKWSTGTTSIATSVASNRLPDWVHGFVLKWTGPIQFLQHIPTLSFCSLWESESGNHADCNAKTPPADNSWLSYLKALWLREGYKDQMSPAKRGLATDNARTLHLTSFNII